MRSDKGGLGCGLWRLYVRVVPLSFALGGRCSLGILRLLDANSLSAD